MKTQSQKNNEQILILNGKIKLLDQKIDLLMNNHLKHIEDKMNTIYKVLWFIVTLSIGVITDILVRLLT
ncbi:MAG: hypothetical protein EBR82_24190 [Caulobacteraceae bacterium]|nr:hypothetical protein [Caulobacteraceae bacterium]